MAEGETHMNIFINILITAVLFYYILKFFCSGGLGTPRQPTTVPPVTAFINMKTENERTHKKQVDNDAIAVLIKLGYNKTEAMRRVVSVYDGIMRTEDTVKMALRAVI